jgi:hypothetical protein
MSCRKFSHISIEIIRGALLKHTCGGLDFIPIQLKQMIMDITPAIFADIIAAYSN